MISFFWKKGFYFNGNLYFYSSSTIYFFLSTLWGLAEYFFKLYFLRLEWMFSKKMLSMLILNNFNSPLLFLLNYYLSKTYPVLLNLMRQWRLNLIYQYMVRTVRGFSFFIGKPVGGQSTRARGYFNSKKPVLLKSDFWFI